MSIPPSTISNEKSIRSGVYQEAFLKKDWHYDGDFKLLFITEGTGHRIVGDNLEPFEPGDLVLLGGYLPHVWISDLIYLDPGSTKCCEAIFLNFDPHILDGNFMAIPESRHIRLALKEAERGLKIVGHTRNIISELMLMIPVLDGFNQVINLLKILQHIGQTKEYVYLTKDSYSSSTFFHQSRRIKRIHTFLMNNYQKQVKLEQLASLVNMSPSAISRFFKQQTGESLMDALQHIRIDYAKKMLMSRNLGITEIAYECGYNSLSFFSRQFKRRTGFSPKAYRNTL